MTDPPTSTLLFVVGMASEARLLRGRRVVVGTAGLEEALAGAAGVVSFGLCGGLDPALRVGDLVVGTAVVAVGERFAADASWTESLMAALPGARRGVFASGGVMVADADAKARLRRATGAAAVDMESHAVARAGLPFVVVRAVSDGADRTLPHAARAGFAADGRTDVAAVLRALAARPWEAAALVRTALDAARALESLRRAAAAFP